MTKINRLHKKKSTALMAVRHERSGFGLSGCRPVIAGSACSDGFSAVKPEDSVPSGGHNVALLQVYLRA